MKRKRCKKEYQKSRFKKNHRSERHFISEVWFVGGGDRASLRRFLGLALWSHRQGKYESEKAGMLRSSVLR
jgi:hypothetical protein